MNFIEELTWRGMIHQSMPGTEDYLKKGMTSAYLGIDPTADSLHIGHLVGVMMLKHFQRSGHKPIALVGGATGMIGDPSMKSQERKLLDVETLRHNQECIKKQLAKFLDFDSDAPRRCWVCFSDVLLFIISSLNYSEVDEVDVLYLAWIMLMSPESL
jgi:tyrosyl-tRNA synthetase